MKYQHFSFQGLPKDAFQFSKNHIKPMKNQLFFGPQTHPKDSIRFSKNHIKPMKYQHFWPQKSPPDSARLHPILKKVKKHKQSKGFFAPGAFPSFFPNSKESFHAFQKSS